jgi:hypothetical protein
MDIWHPSGASASTLACDSYTDCDCTVWQQSSSHFRCKICPSRWLYPSEASRHNNSDKHINQTRLFDSLPPPDAVDAEPLESMHIPLDVPAFVDHDFGFGSVRTDTTLHGPALPDDPPDAIYDDFSGALAMEDEVPDARDSMDIEDAPALRWNEVLTTHTVHEQDGGPKLVSSDAKDTQDAGACAQLIPANLFNV